MIENLGPYHQHTLIYHTDLVALWSELARKWQTDKAKIEGLVNFIPRKYRINRLIFKKEDKKEIKEAMLKALREGFWVGMRSCYLYQPLGKAPWIMALKSRRAIRLFFEKRKKNEKQLWLGTPAHYDEWLNDPGLKEIIVMFNPKKLSPQFSHQHFVARIECFGKQVRVEMRLFTDQTRDIEASAERGAFIILKMPLRDTFRFEKRPIIASFGKKYFKKGVRWPEKRTIEMFDGLFGEFKPKNLKYKRLVKPEVLKIAHQIAKIIFDQWFFPPFNLYYRLQALRMFGLGTVEVQGRVEKEKIDWMLVYGLRGTREVSQNLQGVV